MIFKMSFLNYVIYNYAFLFESRNWSAFVSVDTVSKSIGQPPQQSRHAQANQTQWETFHIIDISAGGSGCTGKLQVSFCYKQQFKQLIFPPLLRKTLGKTFFPDTLSQFWYALYHLKPLNAFLKYICVIL